MDTPLSRRRLLHVSALTMTSISGCLGAFSEEPYYTVEARTVSQDVGVLNPSIAVPAESISTESTATIEISLQNHSFEYVRFTQRKEKNRFGSPYSGNRQVALAEPDAVIHTAMPGDDPCWRQIEPADTQGVREVYRIRPWLPESRQYSVVAPHGEKCLSPGTYTFESTLGPSDESTDWTFELEIREA